MNVFGIGLPEMILIFVVALLIFGPKKLPEIGRSLGKTIKGFQEASKEFQEEFKKEAQNIEETVTMNAKLEPSNETDKNISTSEKVN
ncbi:MAG: TatA/E family twin arginine-targeting protein translocase [Cyanobacteria bacterium]|nr:TatA/E family twin arginine-targeting protein translocase [Cyanobacteria bacterium CG_2015-16_32_12]NCO77900.1 TatA/E family twin arginine-targeting protein translocase [Cyanobacteria bacterium CG_2015-22_32_23]NCQ05841.1 TatA/E family twin arginine-targeting protein translocase [Cyanobacteria bacterium CG_2015-09_32_10]NCQ41998.1 TatA/E family twin arginine-targeting protein translocase [Cyanobacteria bacterium CG_2015-04_32_10]NCS85567.1 TatA/E family twin arginine-targeting protein transl